MEEALSRITHYGRLVGYPILCTPPRTNTLGKFRVYDSYAKTQAQLAFVIYKDEYRKPWEPRENCMYIQSFINFSGYKGLGKDLLTLLIAEARRLDYSITLSATPGIREGRRAKKLYTLYESMGFQRVGPLEHVGTEAESQEYILDPNRV